MRNMKKDVTTWGLNVVKNMTVFRLCGETPSKMLVNKDLGPLVAFQAEILPHAFHSRHRHQCEHQWHLQKHHQHYQQSHVTRLLQHPSTQHQLLLQMSHHRSKHLQLHLQDRLRGQPDHQAMIRLFLHAQWEHQPIHLHGVCVKEVANDLRHLLSATREHVPNLGQIGVTGLDQPESLSRQRLHPACRVHNGLTKVIKEHHQAQRRTEIPVIQLFLSTTILLPNQSTHTMWNTFQDIPFHAKGGFRNTMVNGWTWFRKHQINQPFSISLEIREGEMNLISTDTPSLWACKSFNMPMCRIAASLPVAACSFDFCLRTRFTADHKLSASCEK